MISVHILALHEADEEVQPRFVSVDGLQLKFFGNNGQAIELPGECLCRRESWAEPAQRGDRLPKK